ncbi:ninjurin-B isoform X1 [Zeugodacus cucurbitae]|uniref:ninjurin-B isoform X1 n=1 Tax=Zeugodacus cucurbitae TaxID=28588 RepID=UPI000596964E|nr:ninjurin-B isoform X1 [Zeugodacus cucurbitae]
METKKSVKHTEVIQLDTDDKTIVAALESPNLSSEDTVDNNGISGIDASADVVETDIEPEIYPIAKRLTKSALRRMNSLDYAGNKNLAEGLMDIALLSANANQLRFLLTYNNKAPTYYISLGLVSVSLVLQVVVGLALIFKRHLRKNDRRYIYIKELLIFGIFIITVVNVLIAAFTTTESDDKA